MMVAVRHPKNMTATVRLTRRGAWAQKLDYSEAEQMLRAGATQQEVADRFDVSQAAVSNAIRRGVIKADTNRTETRAVPWSPIAPEHRDQYLVRMLRAYHRREKGLKSAPVIEAQLDTFLRKVEEGDWVVDYSPTDGFVRVPRREGVDLGLVREPGLDNRGRPRRAARKKS
jgi:DNA-binding CsgD family transcriptional regulator